ncbi:MAG: PD40 domain-containing protein [Armatimonadetes bacterium]|nr:PD40 domain-containing protein [Armatimonadota bacterium]
MRPQLITPRKIILALLAVVSFVALVVWLQSGGKVALLDAVPSTAGKIAWIRDGDLLMATADGTNPATLTTGTSEDNEPAWSPGGDTLTLSSNRDGVSRQVYVMNAVPGAKVAVLTNSSTSKAAPIYGSPDDIYFLDGGKIAKITPKTGDIDAVFPSADLKRAILSGQSDSSKPTHIVVAADGSRIFGAVSILGGIDRFAASPDGTHFFATIKQERGEILVRYAADGTLIIFGIADRVLLKPTKDGVIAVFCGGEPLPQPALLIQSAELGGVLKPGYVVESEGDLPFNATQESVVVQIDSRPAIQPITPVPFIPTGLAVSLDSKKATITSTGSTDKTRGVFVFPLDGSVGDASSTGRVAVLAASEPAFSPDGSQVAFVSGDDVFIASAVPGGSAAPVNLTKGAGANTAPAWSPAKK